MTAQKHDAVDIFRNVPDEIKEFVRRDMGDWLDKEVAEGRLTYDSETDRFAQTDAGRAAYALAAEEDRRADAAIDRNHTAETPDPCPLWCGKKPCDGGEHSMVLPPVRGCYTPAIELTPSLSYWAKEDEEPRVSLNLLNDEQDIDEDVFLSLDDAETYAAHISHLVATGRVNAPSTPNPPRRQPKVVNAPPITCPDWCDETKTGHVDELWDFEGRVLHKGEIFSSAASEVSIYAMQWPDGTVTDEPANLWIHVPSDSTSAADARELAAAIAKAADLADAANSNPPVKDES